MARDNWREAVGDIQQATAPVSRRQHQLAAVAEVTLAQNLPHLVAAARLRSTLGADIGSIYEHEVDAVQQEVLASLETPELRVTTPPENRDEAEAWIAFLRLKRRQRALERLELMAGDVVEVDGMDQIAEVSSIGSNGRIYFKGNGGAWPDLVIIRCRKADDTEEARTLKQQAANSAALRARADSWTLAKQTELMRFKVDAPLTVETVEEFQLVIESANDERPIQQFIEEHPETLGALLGGRDRFVLPRYPLGGKYVPDFLISDIDSLGIRWVLVELETPKSKLTLTTQNELDESARRGVTQIKEWREWLQNNLDTARRLERQDGLGLIDIRPMSEGLVLVGRRRLLNDSADIVRNPFREQNAIRIHTYDWLIERLFGILEFAGPPRASPDVIKPPRDRTGWEF